MATAGLDRMMLWTDLEGRTLHGRWRLGKLVRPEGRTAWFEATDVDGKPVMVSITEALNDEDELLERLEAAAEIRHPNVVSIRESRISHVDETPVVVAAMEMTEENLSDVLRERSLNATETRQVLDSVLAGLSAIHARGLVHGRVEAASVLAIGDTIKLRSECVHIGGSGFASGAAEDVRCAGRLITQAMTRRLPSGENDPVLQLLPEPLARAARRALSGNATATEIATLVGTRLEVITETPRERNREAGRDTDRESGRGPGRVDPYSKTAPKGAMTPEVVVPDTAAAEEQLAAKKAAAEKSGSAARVVPMRGPRERAEPERASAPAGNPGGESASVAATATNTLPNTLPKQVPHQREIPWEGPLVVEDDARAVRRRPSTPYVIAGAVAVVLVTLFTLYGMLHHEAAAPQATGQIAQPVGAQSGSHPATAPEKTVVMKAAPAATSAAASGPGWRVIVYTYNREADARHKAETITAAHPELKAGVFHPRAGEPYLVSLGGVMSRPEAIALRAKALAMGMPTDTYARNYH
jgi:hypothetical protein